MHQAVWVAGNNTTGYKVPSCVCNHVKSTVNIKTSAWMCVWMAFVCIFRSSVIPPNNCKRKRQKKEKGLIYLAVKAVAPLYLLLLLRPCPLSGARAWSRANICMPRATWMWSSPDSHYLTCKTSGGPVKSAHAHTQCRCTPVKTLSLLPPPTPLSLEIQTFTTDKWKWRLWFCWCTVPAGCRLMRVGCKVIYRLVHKSKSSVGARIRGWRWDKGRDWDKEN